MFETGRVTGVRAAGQSSSTSRAASSEQRPREQRAALDTRDPAPANALADLLDYPVPADDLDRDPHAESPSPALAQWVDLRDRHPVNPTAGPSPAAGGDSDHTIAKRDGGPTIRDNLASLIRRWHLAKTHTRWTNRRDGGGWQWTSPLGRTSTTSPHDYRLGP